MSVLRLVAMWKSLKGASTKTAVLPFGDSEEEMDNNATPSSTEVEAVGISDKKRKPIDTRSKHRNTYCIAKRPSASSAPLKSSSTTDGDSTFTQVLSFGSDELSCFSLRSHRP